MNKIVKTSGNFDKMIDREKSGTLASRIKNKYLISATTDCLLAFYIGYLYCNNFYACIFLFAYVYLYYY